MTMINDHGHQHHQWSWWFLITMMITIRIGIYENWGLSNHPCSLLAPLLWWKSFKVNLCSCAKFSHPLCYWVTFLWKNWLSEKLHKLMYHLFLPRVQAALLPAWSVWSYSKILVPIDIFIKSWIVIILIFIILIIIILKTCLRPKWEIQRVALSPTPPSFSPPPAQSHPDN